MEAKGVPPISEILAKSPDNMTSDDAFRVFQEHQIPLYEAIKQSTSAHAHASYVF